MASYLGNEWEILALEEFLDWQWSDYLIQQIPNEYLDEIKGKSN